ncbi:predicted protein [Naegleria gruberi]|uniref:tryptophan synthase n=1 Tax=Naegleria gruberi TaxID=5762 RepID=D2VKV7_NAEGR|nr:uncharacterized protein NAEGRDRAFT_80373 [Naegleria gruberi]EFC42510.1 predicted protein [Naegleria gruberi]|eukprot:XP_002675254.1 predicted protein [Naegleria gruberi strain NEG-M]
MSATANSQVDVQISKNGSVPNCIIADDYDEMNGIYGITKDESCQFGGCHVPPQLQKVLERLRDEFLKYKDDEEFNKEFRDLLRDFVGRPTPLSPARNFAKQLGTNAKIYLKREDTAHLGSHKINNCIGQILLAKRMGAKRIIAETGAGQHGSAVAAVCALFGNIECVIYMGAEDCRRQSLNVFRMQMLGAKVIPVTKGQGRLRDAVDEALGDLVQNYENTFYLLGSAVGPCPFPNMVKHFQSVISEESRQQILQAENKLPTMVIACVGGGSNAIGAFSHYLRKGEDEKVRLLGIEPIEAPTLTEGVPYILHGFKSLCLLDENGEPKKTYSVAAGLDYPSVGSIHSYLKSIGRCEYYTVSKKQVLEAFMLLSKSEGIIPALESSHALAYVVEMAKNNQLKDDDIVVVNLSGRGDKDVEQVYDMIKKGEFDYPLTL